MNGRHFKISVFLMLQYALDTPPGTSLNPTPSTSTSNTQTTAHSFPHLLLV